MGARKIGAEEIKEINELYLKLQTYAAVGRALGISPTTVKKYIIKDYMSESNIKTTKFNGIIKDIQDISIPLSSEAWDLWLSLTDEEEADLEILKKEILI